ncbi:coiled-coil domain-containing protein 22 homolog [Oppia nitens]|uniref:coiled-coil domain-containing protein 22 homolog n=1 Tax=Oppia nitens TaxID=1686743 RepID=UPI0023DC1749|nr:coiled-coil domain-containing protein 22 homolog [Oppia nitens]
MEEVDNILIQQLREIGCDIDSEINGIKDLEVYQIMSCVCHCIQIIDQNYSTNELNSKQINHSMNMSIKYKIATQLANICKQKLGYKTDIGYQTFLYGNESDIRKLFLFLLERLPKEEDESRISSVRTSDGIRSRLKKMYNNTVWLPPMKDSDSKPDANAWCVNTTISKSVNFKPILMNKLAPNRRKYYDKCLKLPNTIPSIMEWNCLYLDSEATDNQLFVKSKKVSIESLLSANQMPYHIQNISNNTSISIVTGDVISVTDKNEIQKSNDLSKEEKYKQIIEDLESELKSLEKDIQKHKKFENKANEYENQLKDEIKKLRELEATDKSSQELITQINDTKQEIEMLSHKWVEVEDVLSNQLKQLTLESNAKNARHTALQSKLNDLKKSINSKIKEIKAKESLVKELTEKVPQEWPPSRSSYTKRILEIVTNVKKQNEETKKVLLETRFLQKDINNLSGKLSRTFTVADEEIFKDAKHNEWNRKCYKLLASMHEHCDQLLESVSAIGVILREIRQLEESVETERSGKTASNLSRILADLEQIRLENKQLTKQLGQTTTI